MPTNDDPQPRDTVTVRTHLQWEYLIDVLSDYEKMMEGLHKICLSRSLGESQDIALDLLHLPWNRK